MKTEKLSRHDVVLALKVMSLHSEAGWGFSNYNFEDPNLRVIGVLLGKVPVKNFLVDKQTKELILHLQSFFDNVESTGASFVDHLKSLIRSEWATVKLPPVYVRFGLRIASLHVHAGLHPDLGLQKGLGSSDIKELKPTTSLHRHAWDYYQPLILSGGNLGEYFLFLAGEEKL